MITKTLSTEPARSDRGRPREFDAADAITAATRVFWEHGYHATSVDTLCSATGVFKGSLYRTFGDKHGVLVAAFEQYAEGAITRIKARLAADLPPREALREALLYYTRVSANLLDKRGCFITNVVTEMMPDDEILRPLVEATLQRMTTQFSLAVARGQQAGQFNAKLDAEDVGRFLLCIAQGIRVLNKAEFSEASLVPIVDLALRALA